MRSGIIILLSIYLTSSCSLFAQIPQSANLPGGAYLIRLDKRKPLDGHILQICDFFERTAQIKLSVYKTNIGPIFSHPQLGVVINERELQGMGKQIGYASLYGIITLIVCHEVSHVQQFKDTTLVHYSAPFKKLWECQADILSGYYFARFCMAGNMLDELENIDQDLKMLFSFENNRYGLSNYPSISQRITAVNAGIRIGLSTDTLKQTLPDKKSLLSTSLLLAERIVNYCQQASQDLLLDSSKVDIDVKNGVARFYLSYLNMGKDSITLDFSVQAEKKAGMFDQVDDEFEKNKTIGSKEYLFTLGPGKKISLFDSLKLGGSIDAIIRFPPMPNSQGRFISNSCPVKADEMMKVSLLKNYQFKFSDVTLNAISIDDIIDIVYHQSKSLMYGPAVKRSSGIWYQSIYAFPGSIENNFILRNGRIMFSSMVFQTTGFTSADEKYDMVQEDVSNALQLLGFTFRQEAKDVGETDQETVLTIDKLDIQILIQLVSDIVEQSYYSNHSRHVRKVPGNPKVLIQVKKL